MIEQDLTKADRERILDTLRKRRKRKQERALKEGKDADFYITDADFLDGHLNSIEQAPSQDADTEPVGRIPWLWLVIIALIILLGVLCIVIPAWKSRHESHAITEQDTEPKPDTERLESENKA